MSSGRLRSSVTTIATCCGNGINANPVPIWWLYIWPTHRIINSRSASMVGLVGPEIHEWMSLPRTGVNSITN